MFLESGCHESCQEHENGLFYNDVAVVVLLLFVEIANLLQNLNSVLLGHLEVKQNETYGLDCRASLGYCHRLLDYALCPIYGILSVDAIGNFFLHIHLG